MSKSQLDVNKIRSLLEQVFNSLNITTFVYIDDVFAFNDLEVEKVIGWFADALTKDSETALSILEIRYPVQDDDIWKREFRSKWANLSSQEQRVIIENLKVSLNSQLEMDTLVTQKIGKILPRGTTYKPLPPSKWREQKEQILLESSPDSKILCLFDQDLHYDSGFTEKGSFSGGGLLWDIVESEFSSNIVCGILSHTIPSIEDEIDYRKDFSSNYEIADIDTNKFLPLSKSRLHDDTYLKFVDGLKKLVLNKFVEDLKSTIIDILDESHEQATNKLRDLDVYAFDLMIMTASRESGVGAWEAETIVRISQIFQRDALRQLLFDTEKAISFNQLIQVSRPISQVQILQEDNIYPWVRSIRRQELYEKNSLTKHSPLQVGDIFEKTLANGKTQNFILLAQPCDLTVRANGTRARDMVSLVPIIIREDIFDLVSKSKQSLPLNLQSYWQNFWSTRAILDSYVEDDPTKIAILEFKNAEWLIVDVLDFCVLHENGICYLDLNEKIVPPPQLTEGWQIMLKKKVKIFAEIRNDLDRIQESLDKLSEQSVKEKLWQLSMPKLDFSNILPPIPYSEGIFDFKLKRVERYRQPGADSILKSYMQYMARDAKDFDFAK